jgi:formylglycine-generating enzyme required for sulfatase activity
MREVVQQPAFAKFPELVEACLDDAVETSVDAFVELLRGPAGRNRALWARQLQALRVLDRLDPEAIGALVAALARHPAPEIRRWLAQRATQAAQDILISEPGGYELVKIPGGTFRMGSKWEVRRLFAWDDEEPIHEVQVPDFYLGRYPVTNEEYGRFLTENPDVPEPKYWADRRFNQPRQPGESRHRFPPSMGGIVVAIRRAVNGASFPVDTVPPLEREREPYIYKTAIGKENA